MNTRDSNRFPGIQLRPICALVLSCFAGSRAYAAAENGQLAQVQFNDEFLQQLGPSTVDVSRFSKGNIAAPGEYRADVYVNDAWLGRAQVTLKQNGAENAIPCFNLALLQQIGLDLAKLPPEILERLKASKDACAPLPDIVPSATAAFDNNEQRLDVTVPQAAMNRIARGYVDPKFWDDGVPAAVLQYNGNVYHSDGQGQSWTQDYLGLTAGVNIGPWRFRHNGSLTSGPQFGTHYQAVQTDLERAIAPLKSRLVIGDAFTDGTMFDSVGYSGVQLATDDRMYPESQRGYAPVIRGVARSNALVQVIQNGNLLYETNVAPGPFEIDDLYATGYGGNLEVRVTEADGSQSVSLVPYAPAVNALRAGMTRYSVTAGVYRDPSISIKPGLFQATIQHGFTNVITGYGGVTAADGYDAEVIGAALNTPIGAFGLDVTQSNTQLPNATSKSGQSVRLSYSKLISPTSTDISVAAYRYSSSGYLGLADAMSLRATGNMTTTAFGGGTQRNSFQATVNQTLPQGYGSVYFTGTSQNYWDRSGTDTQFQAGYNNTYKRVNYGMSVSRQFVTTSNRWDNRFMLTASIPLGLGAHAPYSSTTFQHDTQGGSSIQESITGALGVDNQFSYGVNAGYAGGGQTGNVTNVGGNASYKSPVTTITGNASTATGYNQYGGGLSGTVVAYGGGIVFAPSTGDTMAIVEAKDAAGARVASESGLRLDPWGHALVSNLMPFSNNEIEVDPKGLPVSVELTSTSLHLAPTAGAVVRATFDTDNPGVSAIIRAKTSTGEALPFGADVLDASGHSVGNVAQGGRAVIRGLQERSGELLVKWGDAPSQQCSLQYSVPPSVSTKATVWTTIDSTCVAH